MFCSVLKSHRKADTYLYLPKDTSLDELPMPLVQLFSPHTKVTILHVTPERKFARMSGATLLKRFDEDGFYLQIPPTQQDLLAMHRSLQTPQEDNGQ